MAISEEERGSRAMQLGFEPGMVFREVGYYDDIDQDLSDSIDSIACRYDDHEDDVLLDAVFIWYRDDERLTRMLEYAGDEVGGIGMIWLLTPKAGRDGYVEPSVIQDAARTVGLPQPETISVATDWNGSLLTPGKR